MTGRGGAILFFGKEGDARCAHAADYLRRHAAGVAVHLGRRGAAFPRLDPEATYDSLISYLGPWIIPAEVLRRASRAAVNFHPGPPEYPGIGCTNFAIYEGARVYGVTAHHMAAQVDAGPIIQVERFPLHETDTVWSLTQRAYAHLAVVFYEIADLILAGRPLPVSAERWSRAPLRRAELEALCRLTPDMSEEEIRRRVRATTFPGYPGASFEASRLSAGPVQVVG